MSLKNVPINLKIMLIVVLAMLGMIVLFAISMADLRAEMMTARQLKTKSIVETAVSQIGHYAERAQSGELSTEQAQQQAQQAISALRYDGDNYVWINDMDVRMVMHPIKPDLNGKDLRGAKDPDGLNLFVAFVDMVRDNKAGYVSYMWPKPGSEDPQPKISYVAGFAPWGWVVGTGVYIDDVNEAFINEIMKFAGIFVALVLFVLILSISIGRGISHSICSMTQVMWGLSHGALDIDVPSQERKDEIGRMAEAVQVFKDNALEVQRLEEEKIANEKRTAEEKHAMMMQMADDFESNIGTVVDFVSSAATEMYSSTETMSQTAKQSMDQSTAASSAAEEASTNVQTVASAAEELSSSISEISRQVAQSTQIAGEAVNEVEGANTKVQGLATAAHKIGEVVALITDIADQTNLLALNATIEAARAGEAGKGFAVVASEVKNLANQTAKATEEISAQIGGIQSATQDAVHAIGSIGGIISKMNEIASTIAAAVEQQGAATSEIARNVEQAANGTKAVSSNTTNVSQSATETGSAASQVMAAASELSKQSETLRTTVDSFLTEVRAA